MTEVWLFLLVVGNGALAGRFIQRREGGWAGAFVAACLLSIGLALLRAAGIWE